MMLSNHHILCCPLSFCLHFFLVSVPFPVSWLFASGVQRIGASASALPIYIQGWFPLGLTGLISLQFKRLSRIFPSTTIEKHWLFGTQPSLWSNSHIHTRLLEKRTDRTNCWWGCKTTGTLIHYWWEWRMVQPFWKRVWKVLTMLNMLFHTIYKCSIKYLHSFENISM